MIRLLKPLDYYQEKYGSWQYGLQKMYLLMEKQHNRGQEGAGLATVKLDMPPGEEYIWRERMEGKNAIQDIFAKINGDMVQSGNSDFTNSMDCKAENQFAGELYLGHLRYSTTGKSGLSYIHPFLRQTESGWLAFTLKKFSSGSCFSGLSFACANQSLGNSLIEPCAKYVPPNTPSSNICFGVRSGRNSESKSFCINLFYMK